MAEAKKTLIEWDPMREFCKLVLQHYRNASRHSLPWRNLPRSLPAGMQAYRILVSEMMLQQTQVVRVIPKYSEFIRRFPDFRSLAQAPFSNVLRAWQGLGYNRRALYLRRIAERVMKEYGGKLPRDPSVLKKLPGIGPNTAGAIAAFAFNQPAVFIETNIRRAFIHHFFPRRGSVSDRTLLPLIERSLQKKQPREWYAALMDYGAYLGESLPKAINPNRRSKHYTRQAKFEGSLRQIRGRILKLLLCQPMGIAALRGSIKDVRTHEALRALMEEGVVTHRKGKYRIASS